MLRAAKAIRVYSGDFGAHESNPGIFPFFRPPITHPNPPMVLMMTSATKIQS